MQIINGERHPTVSNTEIKGFFGRYRFLSNFHVSNVVVDGLCYPSSENAYMAEKTEDMALKVLLSKTTEPFAAKKIGRSLKLIPNWDDKRLAAMLKVLTMKFMDPELRQMLLDTGDRYLEETNNWGDRFWGVDGTGLNMLGRLLMILRDNIRLQVAAQKALF
ncbi:NADAR family protein [Nostoc sp. CHAB 5834]|nr:NADAR family protein [Nostoc sp. CHAB 5834]